MLFSNSSLLSSLFGWWPDDFVQLLIQMSSSRGGSADGYAGPTLHFGEREYVVVGFWKIGSGLGLAASMLVVALIAVLHEAVLGLRFFLEREQTLLSSAKDRQHNKGGDDGNRRRRNTYVNSDSAEQQQPQMNRRQRVRAEVRDIFRRSFTRERMLQALLYLVQWLLFIFAFVLVPCSTFNFSLIIAALVGKTVGYLLFIHSPAMQSVERIASPSARGSVAIQMVATRKMLGPF
ncbi:hypothetical protein GPALN_004963 [Globodera pallida]|nr:hypothetical protein GPALN_004963 [Globodera pallida]